MFLGRVLLATRNKKRSEGGGHYEVGRKRGEAKWTYMEE